MKLTIIGSGIGGMATGIRLASAGHEVDIYEANDYPGGKLSSFELGDYRFDAGPSLFTMPEYVEELFKIAREPIEEYFDYEKLDIVCRYFWEDGTTLKAFAEPDLFAKEVEEQLDVPAQRIKKALAASAKKYELTGSTFLEKSLHRVGTWLTPEVARAFFLHAPLMGKSVFQSMNSDNEKRLKHPKLVQLFNRYATYNGSNPYKAPAMLNIIPHFEHNIGAFFPKGGIHLITKALYKLAIKKKVNFHFNHPVQKIIVQDKKAVGITVQDRDIFSDAVISNMDVFPTYKKLLPNQKHPEFTLQQPRSTSALIFYWGVKQTFKNLDVHNIFFSDNYKKEFDTLDAGSIDDDPTVYIHISSKLSTMDAPKGSENWFVMINVPANSGQDWDDLIKRAKTNIIAKINRILNIDLDSLIEQEAILEPRTIESKTSSYQGALYGTSSNNRMAAFLRHPNFSKTIQNLYFCGGSVHPGGGIPLCLLSAAITAEMIKEKY